MSSKIAILRYCPIKRAHLFSEEKRHPLAQLVPAWRTHGQVDEEAVEDASRNQANGRYQPEVGGNHGQVGQQCGAPCLTVLDDAKIVEK